ncbi:hypothetical protein [Devosia naphthalenivorans]|uniref:hypothetical protein n=1 Tax=Devosia naphthalenivorans TaxID=2082392 RepID=UPI0013B056B5
MISRYLRSTVEHDFGTIKGWMGATHFRTRKDIVKLDISSKLNCASLHLAYAPTKVLRLLKREVGAQILNYAPSLDAATASAFHSHFSNYLTTLMFLQFSD